MKTLAMQPRVLYFTNSAAITVADQTAAEWISTNVGYRNGSLNPGNKAEPCDAVAGPKIPPLYINSGVPVVTSKTELDAAMKAKAEGAKAPADGVRIKNAKPWGNDGMRRDPIKKIEEIEYMLNADGEPVVIDGQMLVMGSPEQIAYQASLAPVAGGDTQAGAEGAQAGVESPATAPAAASAPENVPAVPETPKRKPGRPAAKKPDNAPKKPAAVPGWGRNP